MSAKVQRVSFEELYLQQDLDWLRMGYKTAILLTNTRLTFPLLIGYGKQHWQEHSIQKEVGKSMLDTVDAGLATIRFRLRGRWRRHRSKDRFGQFCGKFLFAFKAPSSSSSSSSSYSSS